MTDMHLPTSTRPIHVRLVPDTSASAIVRGVIELAIFAEVLWYATHSGEHLHEAVLEWWAGYRERVRERAAAIQAVDRTRDDVRTLPETKRPPFLP